MSSSTVLLKNPAYSYRPRNFVPYPGKIFFFGRQPTNPAVQESEVKAMPMEGAKNLDDMEAVNHAMVLYCLVYR